MITCKHNVDPVIRDLNKYLIDMENHDIKLEHFRALAEADFQKLNYLEIIEYDDDLTHLERLFECLSNNDFEKSKKAMLGFIESVKEVFIQDRMNYFERKDFLESQNDDMEQYYLRKFNAEWC